MKIINGQDIIKITMGNPEMPVKGDYNSECNRTACDKQKAVFFNHATRKYYCPKCARVINELKRADAMRLYGHDLCTEELQTK